MKTSFTFSILFMALLIPSMNCSQATEKPTVVVAAKIEPIKLPELDPAMPDKPGLVAVQTLCNTCHTPHYIMNQPEFTKEVWTAEITKMQKVFNAPIPQEKVPEVLAYLMSVRGKESN